MGGGWEKERGGKEANRPHKTGPKICICFAEGAYGKKVLQKEIPVSEELYIQPTNYTLD